MSKSKSSTARRRLGRAGLATGAAAALLAGITAAPAYAAAGTLALSAPSGPTGGGNTLVATLATAPTSPNPTTFTSSAAAYFVIATSATTAPTCPTSFPSTAPASNLVATGYPNVKLLAPNKIAVVVPAGVVVSSSIYKYAMCVFASNAASAALIASAQYTVGTAPKIAAVNGIAPVGGPALGGTTVTVTGSGFVANTTASPNNTTATLDGVPLTNIVVNGGGTAFSATTPAHVAGGPFLLEITTPGGTVNTLGNTTTKANLFSYTNGIIVSPNTAPNYNGSMDLDVLGVGFSNFVFDSTNGNTPNAATGHVYLTAGAHDPTTNSGAKTKAEITECINVLVISDNELLCSLPLNHTYSNPTTGTPLTIITGAGVASARTGKTVTTTSGSTAITTTNGAFTQADVGMPIVDSNSNTNIAAGTVITAVSSPTSATLSAAALATGTISTANIAGPRTLASVNTATSTTLVGSAGTFTSADVGRVVTSATLLSSATPPAPGIPDNTTIIAVNATGTTATLSAPLTGTISTSTAYTDVLVTQSPPVPNGTYTVSVVNDGSVGAQANATYSQSVVSSGSTFTVADF